MNNDNLLKYIITHTRSEYPKESCGYIAADKDNENRYIPCTNVAKDPNNNFHVHPKEYLDIVFKYSQPIMLCHSHTNEGPEPSEQDIVGCNAGVIPWFILSYPVKNSVILMPEKSNKFIGRPYIYGILDCFSICRDFYKLYDINLPNYYREEDFWNKGYSQYLDLYSSNNFEKIDSISDVKFGDMMLFNMRADMPNHAGIYIGNGQLLHQPQNRLSIREDLGLLWQKTFFCILRPKGNTLNDHSKLTRALKG